jgi:hypothetical protein
MTQLDTALIGLFLFAASAGIWLVGRLQKKTASSRNLPGLLRPGATPQGASARSITETGDISSAAAACFLATAGAVFALLSVPSF